MYYEKMKKYHRNCICLFLAISLFVSPLTVGAGQTAFKTGREKLKTRVTVNYTETPIETILMDLADKAKIDIIKSPKVSYDVTVKVTDVPLEEALTHILAINDCTYIATENMIRVFPLPSKTGIEYKEQQVHRIYKITYADANEVYEAVKKFVSGKAEIGFSKGTSHIMVTDTEDKIKPIDKFVEQVDRITSQVLVEVRIYEVITNEGFELDNDWRVGRNAPYTGDTILIPDEIQEIEIGPDTRHYTEEGWETQTTPVWTGFAEEWDSFQESWTQDSGRKDIERTYKDPKFITTNIRRKPFVGGNFDRETGGTLSFSVLNEAVDIDMALSILHAQVESKLLANPRLLVLDNETANFEIVREIPFREVRQIGREDPITFTAFKNVGVDLRVTPHIARDGMLRLHIVPEFSVLVSRDMLGVSGQFGVLGVPTIDARRLETKAMIKDGQTIVIGGLRQRETSKDIRKVPVLADIPLVGGLFISETESVMINELLVFITTRIVTEPTLSVSEQKLLGKTGFTIPEIGKTRIEKGEFETTGVDKPDITDSLDLLLKKLEPSPN